MEDYAGLDVSVKETSVCVIDGVGQVIHEVKASSEPGAILVVLADKALAMRRIGLEAGRCRNGFTAPWPRQPCR